MTQAPSTKAESPAPGQYGAIKLYAGSGSQELGAAISEYLDIPVSKIEIKKFSNENIFVRLGESVRGQDVYLIQSMASPLSDSILEMLIVLDTLKRDSAGRITAVFPYFAYGRTDKRDQPRVPITARLLADVIQVAGAKRYITLDLHAGQIQGFFSIPGDELTAFHIISDYFLEKQLDNGVIVSADLGFAKKARNYAEKLGVPLAFVEKRRQGNKGKSEVMTLIGDVRGKDAIIIDDECDTAGSMVNAVRTIQDHGARDVYIAFTHPVLSGPAIERLSELDVKEIVTTNSLPIPPSKRLPNMQVLTLGPLLGEVIRRTHEGRSVGEMFKAWEMRDHVVQP
ncbi:MAG: ribose-phosphate pyrophosphokinase [Anaerolineae bacterium]|nr:ribose-phosphate pyrophosphokinase [Anaerolineae bacterium]